MSNTSNQPVHKIRYRSVSVAIWKNEGPNGPFYQASVERLYRDKDDKPQSATSFGLSDLGLLNLALADAARWIAGRNEEEAQQRAA